MASSSSSNSKQEVQETPHPQPSVIHHAPPPLPPTQWRLSLKKPPAPPSRILVTSPPPPPLPASLQPCIHCRTYVSVPRSLYRKHLNLFTYHSSRNSLLPKLFKTMIQCQVFDSSQVATTPQILIQRGIKYLGPPVDYWLIFPLVHPPQPPPAAAPPLESIPNYINDHMTTADQQEAVAHAWAIGPVKATLQTLNWPYGTGPQPAVTDAFPWASAGGTKFPNYKDIPMDVCKKIIGFVRCDLCGTILGLAYDLSIRVNILVTYFKERKQVQENGESVLNNTDYKCVCAGYMNPTPPIIHEDMRKINWLFLFVGCGLGYCTIEQLQYFCKKRQLSIEGNKNELLFRVWSDLYQQLGLPCLTC